MPKAPAPAAPGPASAAVPGVIEGMMQNKRGENVPIVGNKTRIGTICGFEVYEVTSDIRLTDAPENEIWVKAMDPKEQQREQIAAQLGKKFAAQQKRTEAPAKYGAGPGPIVTEEPAVT
jgi:hypothetical protein